MKRLIAKIRQALCIHNYQPTWLQPLSDTPALWCECTKCGHGAYCTLKDTWT